MAIASAQTRGVQLRHVRLCSGNPGVGKTALAVALSAELQANVQVISGIVTAADTMTAMADGDCLVIDEIHLLAARLELTRVVSTTAALFTRTGAAVFCPKFQANSPGTSPGAAGRAAGLEDP